jgi:CheY-like chemotaxis protein
MKTVLVADDEPTLLSLIADLLADEGYAVVTARDGREALDLASEEPPDLILLDVMMPRLDGREAFRLMRDRPDLRQVPVAMMSAGIRADQVPSGVALLSKPFDLDRLLSLVARLTGG